MSNPARPRPRAIRVLAIGLPILHDHVLLAPVHDSTEPELVAYRPLGGGVDFGEAAADAVVREFREETGRAVEIEELIDVMENRFEYEGAAGHEIVFVYLVRFVPDDEPADLAPLACVEDDGEAFEATWFPLAEVVADVHTVYPAGLAARLAAWLNRL